MRLPEYAGKQILRDVGIHIPKGLIVRRKIEAPSFFCGGHRDFWEYEDSANVKDRVGFPVVVKAQIREGGRKHRGLVRIVQDDGELEAFLKGLQIRGYNECVLIEKLMDASTERYLSCVPDRKRKSWVVLYSDKGGVDVEDNGDILTFSPEELDSAEADGRLPKGVADVARRMLDAVVKWDLTLLEINPLSGDLTALDCKAEMDDDALWRHHPYISRLKEHETYIVPGASVMLMHEGGIGIIANGAGLTMATMDAVSRAGGNVGQAIDLAGTDSEEVVEAAYLAVLDMSPRAMIINSFGGITRCTRVAEGILAGIAKRGVPPGGLVVRLDGNMFEEAERMLRTRGISVHTGLREAVEAAVANARGAVK